MGIMAVNMTSIDLRLLVVFDAVMKERSVSRAAMKLNLTQGAVSNALSRFRSSMEDRLFIPSPNGMIPTPRALEIAGPLSESLERIRSTLERKVFDPQGDWGFKIALSDQAALVILPNLLKIMATGAPNLQLHVSTKRNTFVRQQLAAGEIDMAVGIIPGLSKRYSTTTLFADRYVCLMRKDHPLGRNSALTIEDFSRADHLALRTSRDNAGQIDKTLSTWGYKRDARLSVNQLAAVPPILLNTDLVSCLLESVALTLLSPDLKMAALPFHAETVNIVAAITTSRQFEPAQRWMLSLLVKACNQSALGHPSLDIART